MRKILTKIKDYFIRLFRAILNMDYRINYGDIILSKEEEFYYFLENNKKRIKYLMEFNNGTKSFTHNSVNEENFELKKHLGIDKQEKLVKKARFRPIRISKKLANFLNKEKDLKEETNNYFIKNQTHKNKTWLGNPPIEDLLGEIKEMREINKKI
jgi:hypothetical protein